MSIDMTNSVADSDPPITADPGDTPSLDHPESPENTGDEVRHRRFSRLMIWTAAAGLTVTAIVLPVCFDPRFVMDSSSVPVSTVPPAMPDTWVANATTFEPTFRPTYNEPLPPSPSLAPSVVPSPPSLSARIALPSGEWLVPFDVPPGDYKATQVMAQQGTGAGFGYVTVCANFTCTARDGMISIDDVRGQAYIHVPENAVKVILDGVTLSAMG